jgi:aldehyde:ferredoxin oxidoreductase
LDFDTQGILKAGEKIIHLEKAFNVREGLSRKDDMMPERYLKEPIPDGPSKGQVLHLDELLDQYYMARGWDVTTGLVPKNRLEGLGLKEIAEDLEKTGKLPAS